MREQEAAELYAEQQTAAGVPKYLQKARPGGGAPIAELAANGAQVSPRPSLNPQPQPQPTPKPKP